MAELASRPAYRLRSPLNVPLATSTPSATWC